MSNPFQQQDCSDQDVVAFGDATFKAGKLKQALRDCFGGPLGSGLSSELVNKGIRIDPKILAPNATAEDYARWFGSGIECEVLQVGAQKWKKAKVRLKIAIEFLVEAETKEPTEPAVEATTEQPVPSQPSQSAPVPKSVKSRFTIPDELLEDVWG